VQVVIQLYTLIHRKIRQNATVKLSAGTLLQVLDLSPLQRHLSRRPAAAACGRDRRRNNRLGLGMEVGVGVDGILNPGPPRLGGRSELEPSNIKSDFRSCPTKCNQY